MSRFPEVSFDRRGGLFYDGKPQRGPRNPQGAREATHVISEDARELTVCGPKPHRAGLITGPTATLVTFLR